MTDEQINIAIAEACGWKNLGKVYTDCAIVDNAWESPLCEIENLPDYCNDLNAMHEVFLSLSDNDKFLLDRELQRVLLRAKDGPYWLTNATARQRAEAFLKTIGKWEDGK